MPFLRTQILERKEQDTNDPSNETPRWKRVFGWFLFVASAVTAFLLLLVDDEMNTSHRSLAVTVATPALFCVILSCIAFFTLATRVAEIPFLWAAVPSAAISGLSFWIGINPTIDAILGDIVFVLAPGFGIAVRRLNQ